MNDKWIKMVNFKLGYWTQKTVDQHDTRVGQKKSPSNFPTVIQPMTSRTPGVRSIHLATRTRGEQGHLTEFMWQASSIPLGSALSKFIESSDK